MSAVNRRQLLQGAMGGAFASAMGLAVPQPNAGEFQLFWGDLHNHNNIGQAQGSIERTYDIARSHLDFIAFMPHAQWHDMPEVPDAAQVKWAKGHEVTKERWPRVQEMAAENNEPGKFVSFLGYEWHSSFFGDYCVYFPDDNRPLTYFDHVRKLQQFARENRAIIIPHHLAYKLGARGANFDYFDPSVSPSIEIFSEHGLSESDRGPGDYIRHSGGGRWTRNTVRAALARGIRAGFIASSDDHLGFPGAYGEGLAGIYAKELTRKSLLEALWARRTLAVTGDRIALNFRVNGKFLGSVLPFTAERALEVSAAGQDEIERIDIVKNGRVIHRHFPADSVKPAAPWPGTALCRLEYGWGPWGSLNIVRICDWDITTTVRGGKLMSILPCFQSGPFDEKRRHRIIERNENSCRIQSYTSRKDAFEERATNSVVLHIVGERNAVLEVSITSPARLTIKKTLGELAESNEIEFTGVYTSESILVHRLVMPDLFRASFRVSDKGKGGQADWYYVRVCESNGHMAWSSPIWVEA